MRSHMRLPSASAAPQPAPLRQLRLTWRRAALQPLLRRSRAPCPRASPATAATQPDESIYTAKEPPAAWLGPVKAARYVGPTGRGLEAARTLAAGELLIVSEPLALIEQTPADAGGGADGAPAGRAGGEEEEGEGDEGEGEEGGGGEGAAYVPTDADVDELVAQLQAQRGARAAAWLAGLDDGTPERASQLPDLKALSQLAGSPDRAPAAPDHDPDLLADLVDLNYACVREDAALSELRGAGQRDLVGLWPEAALMNHSCTPNTAAVAVEGRLLVRASRAVAKQAELTAAYLSGPLLLSPLRRRQAALRDARGFACRCARCRDEARQDANLLQLVDDITDACNGLEADLADAVVSGRERAVSSIRDQLAAFIEVADAAFNKLALQQKSQIYVQASLFRLYELTALATAAAGEEQPRLLELLAALAGEVAPGSEEHVYWARRYRAVVEETEGDEGRFDGALRQADAACYAAHAARYGHLSRPLYRRVMTAAELAEGGSDDEWEGL